MAAQETKEKRVWINLDRDKVKTFLGNVGAGAWKASFSAIMTLLVAMIFTVGCLFTLTAVGPSMGPQLATAWAPVLGTGPPTA